MIEGEEQIGHVHMDVMKYATAERISGGMLKLTIDTEALGVEASKAAQRIEAMFAGSPKLQHIDIFADGRKIGTVPRPSA